MNTALRLTSATLIAATLAAGFTARPALAADAAPAVMQLPTVVVTAKRHAEPAVQQLPMVVVYAKRSAVPVVQQLPMVVVYGKRHAEPVTASADKASQLATVAAAERN